MWLSAYIIHLQDLFWEVKYTVPSKGRMTLAQFLVEISIVNSTGEKRKKKKKKLLFIGHCFLFCCFLSKENRLIINCDHSHCL